MQFDWILKSLVSPRLLTTARVRPQTLDINDPLYRHAFGFCVEPTPRTLILISFAYCLPWGSNCTARGRGMPCLPGRAQGPVPKIITWGFPPNENPHTFPAGAPPVTYADTFSWGPRGGDVCGYFLSRGRRPGNACGLLFAGPPGLTTDMFFFFADPSQRYAGCL